MELNGVCESVGFAVEARMAVKRLFALGFWASLIDFAVFIIFSFIIVCTNVTASQRGLLVFLSYSTAGFPFCFLFPFLTVKIFNLSGKMKRSLRN